MEEESPGKNPSVKIIIACHKPAVLISGPVFVPVHTGRAVDNRMAKDRVSADTCKDNFFVSLIGDDTGDNISHLNCKFNELTAVYWAWKNYDTLDNPDYIGLMHYRRFFSFNESVRYPHTERNWVGEDQLDAACIEKYRLTSAAVTEAVANFDLILNLREPFNPYYHYKEYHDIRDYDLAMELLKSRFPAYAAAADIYNSSGTSWFCNMFIMKRELFFEYCDWLFTLLFELNEKLDFSRYNIQEYRVLGYLAERLLGIFATYQHSINPSFKIKELQTVYIKNTDFADIRPVWFDNNIAVVLAADENYAPYLSVTLRSLIDQTSKAYNYDILVLDGGLTENSKRLLANQLNQKNISLRFIPTQAYLEKYAKLLYAEGHFTNATYLRLFIGDICKNYSKAVYLDCDLVLLKDIAELFNTDLEGNLVGAVQDFAFYHLYHTEQTVYRKYTRNILKMEEYTGYFNAGVLVMDLERWRAGDYTAKCLEWLREVRIPRFADQCVLNSMLKNRVKYLDPAWNVEWHLPFTSEAYELELPYELLEKYIVGRANPYIMHYSGIQKPWIYPEADGAFYFWQYARQTPFYEQILYRNAGGNRFNKKSRRGIIQRIKSGMPRPLKRVLRPPYLFLKKLYIKYK